MICKKCGSEIQEGEQFCGKCGAKIKKGIMAKYLIIGIAIILIGFLIIGIGDELEKVKVPDVVGLTTEEARKEIEERGFRFFISTEEYSSQVEEGYVISQSPQKNNKIKKGTKINVVISKGEQTEEEKREEERIKNRPSNDTIISCAKTAMRKVANYEPEFGTTKVLEEDDYGRYLISCYAKLVNGFGVGKYYVYYVVLDDVYKQDGEWYYTINTANGVINSANYGENEDLAIQSAKKLNNWDKPKETNDINSNNTSNANIAN